MAKYIYEGSGSCRVGMTEVKPGDVIDSDTNPGKRFRFIPEVAVKQLAIVKRKSDEPSATEGAQ